LFIYSVLLFFQRYADHRVLPSFPTRRSSDLGSRRHRRRRRNCHRRGRRAHELSRDRSDAGGDREEARSGRHPRREWWRQLRPTRDRKSTRLNSSHVAISYAVFCLKKKMTTASRPGPPLEAEARPVYLADALTYAPNRSRRSHFLLLHSVLAAAYACLYSGLPSPIL